MELEYDRKLSQIKVMLQQIALRQKKDIRELLRGIKLGEKIEWMSMFGEKIDKDMEKMWNSISGFDEKEEVVTNWFERDNREEENWQK